MRTASITAGLSTLIATVGIGLAISQPGSTAAVTQPGSESIMAQVDIVNAANVGLGAFTGTFGTAQTGPSGGNDASTFPDPDGVTAYIDFIAPKESLTSGVAAPPIWDARVTINTATFQLTPSGSPLVSIPELHNYVRCAPPAPPQATVGHNSPTVLGEPLVRDTPVTVPVTGSVLGLPDVSTGTITVLMQEIVETVGTTYARARLVLTITGNLDRADGRPGYEGPLSTVTLGDVTAICAAAPTPTPTASPIVSPNASPTVSPTASPTVGPTASPTVSPMASPSAGPGPEPSSTPEPIPSVTGSDSGGLPTTGSSVGSLRIWGLGLVLMGFGLFVLSRRNA